MIHLTRDETVVGDHGRIETRTTTVIHTVDWLNAAHHWPGLKSVIVIESLREIGDRVEKETRFYITSLVLAAQQIGPVVRSHWAIESSLHWVMDTVFRDDECRVRTQHAPANFATLKHMAHNLTRKAPGKCPSAFGARPQLGMTTISSPSSQRENCTRFPWREAEVSNRLGPTT